MSIHPDLPPVVAEAQKSGNRQISRAQSGCDVTDSPGSEDRGRATKQSSKPSLLVLAAAAAWFAALNRRKANVDVVQDRECIIESQAKERFQER